MQLKKRISAVILVILLTGANLAMFKMLDLLDESKPTLHVPVPKNVNWKVRLNIKTIAKKELYTIFFEQEDQEFLTRLRTVVRNRLEQAETKRSLHLNWEEDMVVYSYNEDEANFIVYVVQTKNPEKFNQHVPEYLSKNQMGFALGSNALFLTQKSGKRLKKDELKSLVKKLLGAEAETLKYNPELNNQLIDLSVNNIHNDVKFQHLAMQVNQMDQRISFLGEVEYPSEVKKQMPYRLNSKGIYVYSRFIPKQLPDTLFNFLPQGLPHFKDITSFALDYQGMSLEDPVENMPYFFGHMLVPKMNLIIRTEKPVKIEELWAKFPENVRKNKLQVTLGTITYQLKQLDDRTYFIGIDPSSVKGYTGDDLFILTGDLRKSTKIYGGTFITAFIQNMGPMKAINQFIKTTDSFSFTLSKMNGKRYKLDGSILFKADKYPLHELTRLMINSPFAR